MEVMSVPGIHVKGSMFAIPDIPALSWKLGVALMPAINGKKYTVLTGSALLHFAKGKKKLESGKRLHTLAGGKTEYDQASQGGRLYTGSKVCSKLP